jgi:hypothetical protein
VCVCVLVHVRVRVHVRVIDSSALHRGHGGEGVEKPLHVVAVRHEKADRVRAAARGRGCLM